MKIKNYVIFLFVSVIGYNVNAQVGIGNSNPDKSSMLDITSANSGLLIPRVSLTSSTDAITITSPATSLLVYNTNASASLAVGFCYWDGTAWKTLSTVSAATSTNWALNGNNVTASDYLGTNNYFPMIMKVNNALFSTYHPLGGIAIGNNAAANENNSTAIGTNARAVNSNEAAALGYAANASGFQSLALGHNARAQNNSSIAMGRSSVSSGNLSVAVGYSANSTTNNSLALGNTSHSSGEQAIALGYGATASGQNSTAIGRSATVAQANAIVLGDSSNSNNKVGIGTNAPDERLHVAGSVKIVDGTQADGRVLVSDANGKASWKEFTSFRGYAEVTKTANSVLNNGEIVLGTAAFSQNITLGANPTKIQVTKDGIYKITYTVILRKINAGTVNPEFFLGIYGAEIPGTRTYTSLGNGDTRTVTMSKLCNLTAYQEVSIYSNMADGNTTVLAGGTHLLVEAMK
ncbi:hypothetical protein [Flavobacterium sp.]|uniref:hypothetical protein n=1 Tax=Flavobacterium sp. TaxID=239 RepID=UPI0028BE9239|nr:hypothetical protein [Flavobacterium sp.]